MPREGCSSRSSKWRRSKGLIRLRERKSKPFDYGRNMCNNIIKESLKKREKFENVGIMGSAMANNETQNVFENVESIIIDSTTDKNEIVNVLRLDCDTGIDRDTDTDNDTNTDENETENPVGDGLDKESNLNSQKMLKNIRELFLSHQNLPNTFLSGLLKVLSEHPCFSEFPKDARTLLKSTNFTFGKIRNVDPGVYYHFGIKEGISVVCKDLLPNLEKIDLVIGIDGLPLTKSTNNAFWPILGYIDPYKSHIFMIGVYYGKEKPKCSNDFLKDFSSESLGLEKDGFIYLNKIIPFCIKLFCLDAPAKSFILKIKGHSGFSSCTRCDCKGIHLDKRVSFPSKSMGRRTHLAFLNKEDPQFHLDGDITILSKLNIDLVTCFSLDYMHLVCLGTMKKILLLLISNAPLNLRISRVKHSGSSSYDEICSAILSCSSMIPQEFNRNCRSFDEVKRWKATEHRTFLLYVGPLVLHENISKIQYENFLSLSIAFRILLSPDLYHLAYFAQELLQYFVKSFSKIYGNHLISHNIHGLLHIFDDYKKFGPLDNCSCFCFENFMQIIKKKIRKPEKPLEQLVNRYREKPFSFQNQNVHHRPTEIQLMKPLIKGCNVDKGMEANHTKTQFTKLKCNGFTLTIHAKSKKNSYFISKEKEVVKIHNFISNSDGKIEIFGHSFKSTDWFDKPLKSSLLCIFKVGEQSSWLKKWSTDDIEKKCLILPKNDITIALPLIHSSI